jgi:hypothetical protein
MNKTKIALDSKTQTTVDVNSEVSKVAVIAFSVISASIGIWAVASVIAGILHSGGPIPLLKSLFTALTGN